MSTAPRTPERQRGLSLIEVLVGIAIGLIGILVIFQTLNVWDKYSRTTTSGSDAQTAGTLATFNLERDLKLAGLGFGTAKPSVMGCVVNFATGSFPLAPVNISPATALGVPGTDEIEVLHGNSAFFVTTETFTASTSTTKTLKRRGGFRVGDVIVVAGNDNPASAASADCNLVQVTSASAPDGLTISHAASGPTATYSDGFAFNLGPGPQRNIWYIGADSTLRVRNLLTNVESVVAENVVDLKAEYGVDLNDDRKITSSAPDEWTTVTPADATQVMAVRIAVLVRGRQLEKDTDAPSAFASAAVPSWFDTDFTMRNVDNTADSYTPGNAASNNWRNYRYRVYERVIPLRNMIWGAQFE